MADLSGTDVHYKRESKLGVTTLTFRKRRYMFPSVIIKGNDSVSASTGDLQSSGTCLMVDVGMFCPHCAGAISAKLSGSHSKLIITKQESSHGIAIDDHQRLSIQHNPAQVESEPQSVPPCESGGSQSKHAKIKRIQTETDSVTDKPGQTTGDMDLMKTKEQTFDTDQYVLSDCSRLDKCDKLSSSDYESLDRDSRLGSLSSKVNSTETCMSAAATGSITATRTDDAYSSLTSSDMDSIMESNTQSLHSHSPNMSCDSKFSSLPKNIRLPSNHPLRRTDQQVLLDNLHLDISDSNEEVLVEELLDDEIIDEENQNVMNESLDVSGTYPSGSKTAKSHHQSRAKRLHHANKDIFVKYDDDDNISNRSDSPEIFVDDVLENVDGEVFSGDATLPRVFSLKKEGTSKYHNSKRKMRRPLVQQSSNDSVEQDQAPSSKSRTHHKPRGITNDCTSNSLQRKTMKELVRAKYKDLKNTPDLKLTPEAKSSFSHEDFFEEVVEALTDLEEGFTTDWTSDYDSDMRDFTLSTPDSDLLEADSPVYTEDVGRYDNVDFKPPTSSCECIADDRSRDIDSSLEHIYSITGTPSETSTGDYSMEGYGSSSECSYVEQNDEYASTSRQLLEQLIQETQNLTEDLKFISLDDTSIPVETGAYKDQYDMTDEVFLGKEPSLVQAQETPLRKDTCQYNTRLLIPQIIEPEHGDTEQLDLVADAEHNHRSDSDDSSIDENSSLDNLLSCNAIHCSTSDLDEPYTTELKHAGYDVDGSDNRQNIEDGPNQEKSSIEEDFQKCLHTKTAEIDEFIPELENETHPEALKEAYEAAKYVASLLGGHHITEPHVCSAHEPHEKAVADQESSGESMKCEFESAIEAGNWKELVTEADTKVASFEASENMSKEQAQQFIKYVMNQSSHTHHSHEHTTDLDACLDEVCQTCELKPEKEDEVVKNEEVTTQEVTLVFAWPKKLNKSKQLMPANPKASPPEQPFRTIHLRRVMRVSDFDVEVMEGPTLETVEYGKDGETKRTVTEYEAPEVKKIDAAPQKSNGKQVLESPKKVDDVEAKKAIANEDDGAKTEIKITAMYKSPKRDNRLTVPTEICEEAKDETMNSTKAKNSEDESNIEVTDGHFPPMTAEAKQRRHKARQIMDETPTLIAQNERNVKLLDLDKYFSPKSNSDEVSPSLEEIGALKQDFVHPEELTKKQDICPRCSDIYVFDDQSSTTENKHQQMQHPAPCPRCIMLEREIKQKLEELTLMVEGLGRRRSSFEDQWTITEKHNTKYESDLKHTQQYNVVPGHKSTSASHSRGERGDKARPVFEQCLEPNAVPYLNDASCSSLDSHTESTCHYQSPSVDEIERYADNMSKYIMFRAKLFIVLQNATIVHAPRISSSKELDRMFDPVNFSETEQSGSESGSIPRELGISQIIDRFLHGDESLPRNQSTSNGECKTYPSDVSFESDMPASVPVEHDVSSMCDNNEAEIDIPQRVKFLANIQARIELNMHKIQNKITHLKQLAVPSMHDNDLFAHGSISDPLNSHPLTKDVSSMSRQNSCNDDNDIDVPNPESCVERMTQHVPPLVQSDAVDSSSMHDISSFDPLNFEVDRPSLINGTGVGSTRQGCPDLFRDTVNEQVDMSSASSPGANNFDSIHSDITDEDFDVGNQFKCESIAHSASSPRHLPHNQDGSNSDGTVNTKSITAPLHLANQNINKENENASAQNCEMIAADNMNGSGIQCCNPSTGRQPVDDVLLVLPTDNQQAPQLSIPLAANIESVDIIVNVSDNDASLSDSSADIPDLLKTEQIQDLDSVSLSPSSQWRVSITHTNDSKIHERKSVQQSAEISQIDRDSDKLQSDLIPDTDTSCDVHRPSLVRDGELEDKTEESTSSSEILDSVSTAMKQNIECFQKAASKCKEMISENSEDHVDVQLHMVHEYSSDSSSDEDIDNLYNRMVKHTSMISKRNININTAVKIPENGELPTPQLDHNETVISEDSCKSNNFNIDVLDSVEEHSDDEKPKTGKHGASPEKIDYGNVSDSIQVEPATGSDEIYINPCAVGQCEHLDDLDLRHLKSLSISDDDLSLNDDLSSIASSEISDISVVTAIHIPRHVHDKGQNEQKTDARHHTYKPLTRSVSDTASLLHSNVTRDELKPQSSSCGTVWHKRSSSNISTGIDSRRSVMATVIPEGITATPVMPIHNPEHIYPGQRPSVCCFPVPRTAELLGKTIAHEFEQGEVHSHVILKQDRRSTGQARKANVDDGHGSNHRGNVEERIQNLKTDFDQMLYDVRQVKDQFHQTHKRHRSNISYLRDMTEFIAHPGQHSDILMEPKRLEANVQQCKSSLATTQKSLSCDAIQKKPPFVQFHLGESASDPVLPHVQATGLEDENEVNGVKNRSKNPSLLSCIQKANKGQTYDRERPQGVQLPTVREENIKLPTTSRESGRGILSRHDSTSLKLKAVTADALNSLEPLDIMLMKRPNNNVDNATDNMQKRRWSETDLDSLRYSSDFSIEEVRSLIEKKLIPGSGHVRSEETQSEGTFFTNTSSIIPDFSRQLQLYGPYMLSRSAQLCCHERTQVRMPPSKKKSIADRKTRRTSSSSPARTRSRSESGSITKSQNKIR